MVMTMPKPRSEVHTRLQELTGYGNRVYYNPSESVKMQYPCIVYNLDALGAQHADNRPYKRHDVYSVTHIYTKVSQESMSRMLADEPGFKHTHTFISDNLHHDVFTLTVQ